MDPFTLHYGEDVPRNFVAKESIPEGVDNDEETEEIKRKDFEVVCNTLEKVQLYLLLGWLMLCQLESLLPLPSSYTNK